MSRTSDVSAERVAKNDAAFRDANEQIQARAEELGAPTRIPFLCECAREDCTEIIWLTPSEYEAVRADSRHFFKVPGHERYAGPTVDVIREEDGYIVVEKQGHAAEVVEALDPRNENGS